MIMAVKSRDIKPLLLKFGVALALSFAGFLYSRLRTRRIKPSQPPPRSSDTENEADLGVRPRQKDVLNNATRKAHSSSKARIVSEKYEDTYMPKVSVDDCTSSISPSNKHIRVKDSLLLPEFNDLVNEFDFAGPKSGFSPMKNVETRMSDVETPRAFRTLEKDDYELEIRHLRDMVRKLRERERHLEVQLLEYYGLKEQETAVMELQNRLKISSMEAKLFSLKIESLQAENCRLEGQASNHAKVVAELEATRAKIQMLKKKLRSEAEHNKEQILSLKKRVENLQDNEAAAVNLEIQLKLRRLKDLEGETEELRASNLRLQLQNSELARRLESTQILANSILEDPEAEALKKERERLRQENEDLAKEIEQLRVDRSSDVEELVYLRWINACLRYELRNYQPQTGKTVARDLSKSLSHKSEEKAKQLILEYANTEGAGDKGSHIDFESDRWTSPTSLLTDLGEYDDFSADHSSATKTHTSSKHKLFSKLRRIIWGKDTHDQHHSEDNYSPYGSSSKSVAAYGGPEGQSNIFSSHSSSRASLDLPRWRSPKEHDSKDTHSVQRHSDVGVFPGYKRFILGGEGSTDSPPKDQFDHDSDSAEKSELVKYAEALKTSRTGTPALKPNVHRKSASAS
ncbi:protein CHUP1, chloroplastic [Rosa sericea]